jgi:hypothetical protein
MKEGSKYLYMKFQDNNILLYIGLEIHVKQSGWR